MTSGHPGFFVIAGDGRLGRFPFRRLLEQRLEFFARATGLLPIDNIAGRSEVGQLEHTDALGDSVQTFRHFTSAVVHQIDWLSLQNVGALIAALQQPETAASGRIIAKEVRRKAEAGIFGLTTRSLIHVVGDDQSGLPQGKGPKDSPVKEGIFGLPPAAATAVESKPTKRKRKRR